MTRLCCVFGYQLEKRREKREEAKAELEAAKESENQEDVNKYNKRLVRVSKEQNEDVKRLLRLMGIPVIEVTTDRPTDRDRPIESPHLLRA